MNMDAAFPKNLQVKFEKCKIISGRSLIHVGLVVPWSRPLEKDHERRTLEIQDRNLSGLTLEA